MNLTILLRVALAVAVLPLAAPSWAEELKDHKLRAKFHPVDCEEWLAENVESHRANLLGGFTNFPVVGIVVERVGVSVPPLIDLSREDADFVWFTSPKSAKPKEIAEKLNRLRAEQSGYPARPLLEFDASTFNFNAPMSEFEKDALGLDFDAPVGPKGIRGKAFATREGWRIVWRIRGQTAGGLDLPTRDAQIGYSNSVYEFQWDAIASQRLRGLKTLHWPGIPEFIHGNGHALWQRTSEKTGQRFGYALRTYHIGGEKWVYQLEVYKVRSTPRQAASPADIVFPGAFDPPFGAERPQMMNLQIIDVGLRLPLDPNPTNE